MGRSPDVTRQFTETESSKLDGDSPKSKGASLGGAVGGNREEDSGIKIKLKFKGHNRSIVRWPLNTIDNQLGRVFRRVRIVSRLAGVISRVSSVHGVYGQDARLLTTLDYRHSGIGTNVGPVEQPGDVHRQVAQVDETIHRDRLFKVHGMIPKVEMGDLGGNLVGGMGWENK